MQRGTLAEFNTQHNADCKAAGLPIIGYVDGKPAPENQQTTALYSALQNPNKTDDYIWQFTSEDITNLGWTFED